MIQRLSDFDYILPQELVAQKPSPRREKARLLVLTRSEESVGHHVFRELPRFCEPGDLLVLNDTKVVAARLMGHRQTGGAVEVFLLERAPQKGPGAEYFHALIKPLGRLKVGETIYFKKGFSCVLVDAIKKIVAFRGCSAKEAMEAVGQIPLPPYIRREPTASDKKRYQTVYARKPGAVAAPTAGLHFTQGLFKRLKEKGVHVASLTLHVNYATFSPVFAEDIRLHQMARESFEVPAATVEAVRRAKKTGRRVIAVGTTATKALEDAAADILSPKPARRIARESRLFITPPYDFKIVDALITNFHLPRTTLLMLVSAFAGRRGRDFILRAYQDAIRCGYRFYSYGDAMFIV